MIRSDRAWRHTEEIVRNQMPVVLEYHLRHGVGRFLGMRDDALLALSFLVRLLAVLS